MGGQDSGLSPDEETLGSRLLEYGASIILPFVIGCSAAIGGVAIAIGAGQPHPWLEVVYFAAIALVVGGVVSYFLIGLWLLPASIIGAGLVQYSVHQTLLGLSSSGWAVSIPYLLVGLLGMGWGIRGAARSGAGGPPSE
ncbi:MAG: hypothetical protein L3J95_00785 [Thermoplasmata archaeon]|nr:hypothetical protein [Thermoplasmata archaeon]MCI4358953.1 hypothetical protein [Thermoplasmata archaeon]